MRTRCDWVAVGEPLSGALGFPLGKSMIVCPHCGWNNPGEAAFCTNCGRGLGRARTARLGGLEEAVAETKTSDANRKFRALDAAGRTARDHEMPLLRSMIFDVEAARDGTAEAGATRGSAPPPAAEPLLSPPPFDAPPPAPDGRVAVAIEPPGEMPPVAVAIESLPVPVLRAPVPSPDAGATLVDFRMPPSFFSELAQSAQAAQATIDGPPPPDPFESGEGGDAVETADLRSGPPPEDGPAPLLPELSAAEIAQAVDSVEEVDAEEFPGLAVSAEAAAEPLPRDTARPGERPLLPTSAAPPQGGVSEILPLAALSPNSPLRVARIIEPIEEEDIEIPSQSGGDHDLIDEPGLLGSHGDHHHASSPLLGPPVDLASLEEVDLDAEQPDRSGRAEQRLDEVEADDFDDISVSDVEALDAPLGDVHTVRSGEMEVVRFDGGNRPAPPPLKELQVRYVLRPLSTNMAESRLISITERGLTVGRGQGDVGVEDDPFVSPRHVRLMVEGDALFAEDLGSLNGTWLRVRNQVELRPGDTFRVGHQIMRIDLSAPLPSVRPASDGTQLFRVPAATTPLHLSQIVDGQSARNIYFLPEQGVRIGRHIADIVFTEDTFMSGTHAIVLPRGDRAVLQDLASRNGTWVRLQARQPLTAGDALMIGQTVWRVGRPVA